MSDDRTICYSALVAMLGWAVALSLLVASWLVWVLGGTLMLCIMLAATACVGSVGSAVLQIRYYFGRELRMMRLLCSPERPDAEVREFSPRG